MGKKPSIGGVGRAYQLGLADPYAKKPPLLAGAPTSAARKMWKRGQRDGRKKPQSDAGGEHG